jgi:hypothetical protein
VTAASCRACRCFDGDSASIERGLAGLASLSSGHGASRAGDGLCRHHDRYVRATALCASLAPIVSHASGATCTDETAG